MTALDQYDRLEATGIWRAGPQEKRRDVIVSVGQATLVVTDMADRALAHWSLAAVARANPGEMPAVFHPDGDPGETLELSESEKEMIAAIEKVRSAVNRRRPRPGRLRAVSALAVTAAVVALAVFWVPGAVQRHAVAVVPDPTRAEIGIALLDRLSRVTGRPCSTPRGDVALAKLARRVAPGDPPRLEVVRQGVDAVRVLPGRLLLLNRALVEDFEDPAVVAGFALAGLASAETRDPLDRLLDHAGPIAAFRLLTTGRVTDSALDDYARDMLRARPPTLPDDVILARFAAAELPTRPYAYAVDVSGETTIGLIEADPMAITPAPEVLGDGDWISLQAICGG